ncbi:MAG TPA: SDR family NAD(P)-dependent oxidoreductase [bacterium]|nr:SDR family NAD(P)-dependent oxidoreductase [bacterium]
MAKDTGKTVVITGGGSGIGREVAMLMGKRGAFVVVCDINESAASETAALVCGAGGSASACVLNVTDAEAFRALADEVMAEHGHIDYLFNNAGIGIGGDARDFTVSDWRKVLDVNLNGVVHGVAAVYPHMAERGAGHIINTSSLDGLVPFPGHGSYTASKYAVVGLSHALRIEAAPLGVRVSVVCPGRVKTPIFDNTPMVNYDRKKVMRIVNAAPAISPDACAKIILRGVDRNQGVILTSDYVRLMWLLERTAPELLHGIMSIALKLSPSLRVND